MKRILSFCLIIATLLSVSAPLTLIQASESQTAAPSVNYGENCDWDKKFGSPTVSHVSDGALITNISNSWDSAGCNILPAIKTALGMRSAVSLKITLQLTATLKDGYAGESVSVRPLLRGTDARSDLSAEEWNTAYAEAMGDHGVLFRRSASNVMMPFDEGKITLTDSKKATYEAILHLNATQIDCAMLSEWVLCIDNIQGIDMIKSIRLENLTIHEATSSDIWGDTPEENTPLLRDITAEIYSPAEILLRSTIGYANPYTATEIDATFTHTDGTTISLPGFWMEGTLWAVRFSPTKLGEWSYSITCKDEENKGLFATGKITAVASTADTATAKHGFITTKKNRHYYLHEDGTPFFWLGDTNWQAFTQVSTTLCNYPGCDCGNQFKHIVDDRVDKGFTVYQTYFVPETRNGEPTLWLDTTHKKPNVSVFNGKVDEMFEYLHEQGLVVALGLGCSAATMQQMKLEDFLRFTRYVVARYACYSVVWITAQEITDLNPSKTPGYSVFDCYIKAAELVEELDGYQHPNSAHMYPMVAEDERAVRLDESDWHDSWTIQGGHPRVQSKFFYEGYYIAKGSNFYKPFIEAEANYEDINCGGFTGYDLNRHSAWTAMLCGSAGFTYGATGIWANCFSTETFAGWYGETKSYSYDPWYAGLGKPGSFEVGYMKEFFTAIGPWYDLIPRFFSSWAASFVDLDTASLASTEDSSLIVSYFYHESTKTGTLNIMDPDKTYDAYWFNPRTGKFIPVAKDIKTEGKTYTIPNKPDSRDWVFLLTSLGLPEHYEEDLPLDLNPDGLLLSPTGTPVAPASVSAVGGITYSGKVKGSQTMTDHTLWLYDGEPATVWKPSANRSTQTFLFDLGAPQALTHLTITPNDGTVIPHFRIEVSNDGERWTILVDSSTRGGKTPFSCSEPLTGVYRYVKVLLLNAENVYNTPTYKTMYNEKTGNTYSVTEIKDIVIYSNGEGVPTPERLVAASTPSAPIPPDEDTDDTSLEEDCTDTEITTDGESSNESGTKPNDGQNEKTPEKRFPTLPIAVGAALVIGIGAVICCTILRRKTH